MQHAPRILVGLVAALFLFTGLQFWFALDAAVQGFGFGPQGVIGRASVRADVGGFFIGGGLITAYAAWKRCAIGASAAAVLVGIALLGRLLTVAMDGTAPGATPPMIVEVVAIAILLWARKSWRTA